MKTLENYFPDSKNFYCASWDLYRYTDCGPWCIAVLPDGREIQGQSPEAEELKPDSQILYIKVGSIVEGWDGELDPYNIYDPAELDNAIKDLNTLCSDIWSLVPQEDVDDDERECSDFMIANLAMSSGGDYGDLTIECSYCKEEVSESDIVYDEEETDLEGLGEFVKIPYCKTCAENLEEEAHQHDHIGR